MITVKRYSFSCCMNPWTYKSNAALCSSILYPYIYGLYVLFCFQITLQVYSFENVIYHVLHERVPKYSSSTLTEWWGSNMQRWRVMHYYRRRCQANIQILNHIDFINRTSELARVFGILFYEVISRGSQVMSLTYFW